MLQRAGALCHGVMIHVTNAQLFRPVATYLALITIARTLAGEAFEFRRSTYEFETEKLAFDLLTGSEQARRAIEESATPDDVISLVTPVDPSYREGVALAEARVQRASA